MAKSKKNIDAFQRAMLSNTKMIGNDESSSTNSSKISNSNSSLKPKDSGVTIDPDIYKKYEEMGRKYGIDPNILLSKSLNLFISLENYWFD